ncbi:MAG: 5-bromo-4-chloroindolyl phosphate hydrolysis family protein [Lachnospiraceae bacterium]
MDKKDFSQWEEEIKTKVEKSIDSIHFEQLGKNIEKTIDKTMEQAMREVKKAWEHKSYVEQKMDGLDEKIRRKVNTTRDAYINRNLYRNANRGTNRRSYRKSSYPQNQERNSRFAVSGTSFPVAKIPSGSVSGVLQEVFGGIGTGFFGLGSIIFFLDSFSSSSVDITSLGVCLILSFLFGLMFLGGVIKRKRVQRFKKYVKIMEGECHYPIEKLAAYMGQKKDFTVKDLNKMTELGMFPEGHLDEKKTDFILDHETYQLYLNTVMARKQREQEEERELREREVAAKKEQEIKQEVNKEQDNVERVLTQGNIYIKKIRECNDKIPGDIVSQKLFKMEHIANKIFEHIKKHPNKVEKIEKFMDYYLPTTLKLVTTYQELDSQPIEGENIRRIKVDIEETLDTINMAFEKLLDGLFEDEMLDISSDISVLETVLKQEGLAESDFSMNMNMKN